MSQVTYQSEKIATKRVYYTGGDALQEGALLCYDRDSTSTGGSAGAADPARAYEVEKPAEGNLKYFAGVVGLEDAGKTGPCWVSVIEPQPNPGRLVMMLTDQNCTLGATRLAAAAGSYAAGAAGPSSVAVATAMQTADRSGTPGTVLAQLEGASSIETDVAAAVAAGQLSLVKPAGSTTGGTAQLASANCAKPSGGTTGGTAAFETCLTGLTAAGSAAHINNNFTKVSAQISNIRGDFARLVKEVNAARTDVAAILTALKNANLMGT
jgi:hypothetical protein